MKNVFTLLLLVLLLVSCSLNSSMKMREKSAQTKTLQHSFKKKIPVEVKDNLVFVKVEIRGKLYNFLFDTGATNCVLDDDFAKALKLPTLANLKVRDANQIYKKLPFVNIEQMSIQDVDFQDVMCYVSDLSVLQDNFCTPIDGIIGTNLMAKAVWQLDYANSTITFANHKDSLDFSKNKKQLSFSTRTGMGFGIPALPLRRNNNHIGVAILDTGASGMFDVADHIFNILADTGKKVTSYSIRKAAFGNEIDTSKLAVVGGLNVGDTWTIDNLLIGSRRGTSGIVGGGFMKDFLVTFDWNYQEVTFDAVKSNDTKSTFGFGLHLKDSTVIVGSLLKNSSADKAGIQFLDQVVNVNGEDCTVMSVEQFCTLSKSFKKLNQVKISILQNDKIVEKNIEKASFDTIFK